MDHQVFINGSSVIRPQLDTSAWGEDSAGRTVQLPFHAPPKHHWLRPTLFTRCLASVENNRTILYRPLPPAANCQLQSINIISYHISYHVSLYHWCKPALTASFKFLNETNISNSATFFHPWLRLTSLARGGQSSLNRSDSHLRVVTYERWWFSAIPQTQTQN